ncbi:hypothetical protein HUG10_02630 [Halorarum halophilum]|uniref:Uncharacterized protein n=1 Tax=Halorarum halophilum TaxID=2743090 RepID=A0A7D5KKZ7_9EURY|nr:hypothetical protein [Halobaculum halophilum]QLG26502.1 hypothetical protein HUG10_02630 [Halobaculum halophilum]
MTGLILFVVGGSVMEVVSPNLLHWIHGIAALLVILGLYSPVNNVLRKEEWVRPCSTNPHKFASQQTG